MAVLVGGLVVGGYRGCSQLLQDQEGSTPVDLASVRIYIWASAGLGFAINSLNSPYLRLGFLGAGLLS
jgi:hypothetical protein